MWFLGLGWFGWLGYGCLGVLVVDGFGHYVFAYLVIVLDLSFWVFMLLVLVVMIVLGGVCCLLVCWFDGLVLVCYFVFRFVGGCYCIVVCCLLWVGFGVWVMMFGVLWVVGVLDAMVCVFAWVFLLCCFVCLCVVGFDLLWLRVVVCLVVCLFCGLSGFGFGLLLCF